MPYTTHETAGAIALNPQPPANAAVIWLHGLGADGHDFVPVIPELRLPDSLRIRFVFPHAQPRSVTINNGFVMRAWYDIVGLSATSTEDDAGIRASEAIIREYIEREVASGIAPRRIVVAGFSQGGAVALHTALRYPERLAGVLVLSTYLPLRSALAREAAVANRDVPILMCHGAHDSVVPLDLASQSRDALIASGYRVEWHRYAMAHEVCMQELIDISKWLQVQLALS